MGGVSGFKPANTDYLKRLLTAGNVTGFSVYSLSFEQSALDAVPSLSSPEMRNIITQALEKAVIKGASNAASKAETYIRTELQALKLDKNRSTPQKKYVGDGIGFFYSYRRGNGKDVDIRIDTISSNFREFPEVKEIMRQYGLKDIDAVPVYSPVDIS